MRKPDWLWTAIPAGVGFETTNERLRTHGINTVCSSARCPNLAECWRHGTATLMLLGNTCTRHCRFCAVPTGNPKGALDETEPERVAGAVAELGLRYVVLTSVDRDDLSDLGAGIFAETVRRVKGMGSGGQGFAGSGFGPEPQNPRTPEPRKGRPSSPLLEVLTPDFGGREELIRLVVEAGPSVFGHNLETVERLTPQVRDPRASYGRSLEVLATVKRIVPGLTTKSGLMVGLGESDEELRQALRDLRSVGCDIVTVGQYLRPARHCLPVERYVRPEEFSELEQAALKLGFAAALCGPLVRSSYRAEQVAK
ncbi:lipoyl synthase [candidate division WOR-3 bacterium]|nr:lipoyl synthase [candidate division WOR-3 bacterium]